MIYTLLSVKKSYAEKLEKYRIEVDAEKGFIKWECGVLKLPQNASSAMCKREINKIVKAAQQLIKDRELAGQETLF